MNAVFSKKGTTSIFLTMIFASIILMISIFIYEGSQLAGRSYADAVLDLAGRSILSEYDIALQKKYGIFAVYAEQNQVEDKIKYYANYSFHQNLLKETLRREKHIDPLKLKLEFVDVNLKGYSITNTDLFEKQILEYMKYGIAKNILTSEKHVPQMNLEIELKNQQIMNSLPSYGYRKSSIDIKKILENGIPSLQEIKASSMDSFYTNEYILSHFLNHRKGDETRNTFFLNETEYILTGNFNDKKNYESVRSDLMIMRTGLNLTHIYSDSIKREEVIALAAVLTPGPEAVATQLVIAAVWSAAEAENDLRLLEAGKQVALIKSRSNWALDLTGVMNGGGTNDLVEPQNKSGIEYEDYLRILLFLENREIKLLRCMDLIQLNMKGSYNADFDLKNYYGGFQFEATVEKRTYTYIQKY